MAAYAQQFAPHPDASIASPDVAFGNTSTVTKGVFTVASSADGAVYYYFVVDLSLLPSFHTDRMALGFDQFFFTPFAGTKESWDDLHPMAKIRRIIPTIAPVDVDPNPSLGDPGTTPRDVPLPPSTSDMSESAASPSELKPAAPQADQPRSSSDNNNDPQQHQQEFNKQQQNKQPFVGAYSPHQQYNQQQQQFGQQRFEQHQYEQQRAYDNQRRANEHNAQSQQPPPRQSYNFAPGQAGFSNAPPNAPPQFGYNPPPMQYSYGPPPQWQHQSGTPMPEQFPPGAPVHQQQYDPTAALQQLIQALGAANTSNSSISKPPSFPDWDGTDSSKREWLEKIECFKEAPFFAPVKTWHQKEVSTETQSRWIRKELIQEDRLPPSIKASILNVVEFKTDGFKMLSHLLTLVSGTTMAGRMQAVRDLVALDQSPSETSGVYMARIRDIEQVVGAMTVSEVLPLFALAHLNSSRYPGLNMRYVMNDPLITNASVCSLEQEMVSEEGRLRDIQRHGQLPDLPAGLPAVQRAGAGDTAPRTQPQPRPPSSQPHPPPKKHSPPTGYPLPAALLWKQVADLCPSPF